MHLIFRQKALFQALHKNNSLFLKLRIEQGNMGNIFSSIYSYNHIMKW